MIEPDWECSDWVVLGDGPHLWLPSWRGTFAESDRGNLPTIALKADFDPPVEQPNGDKPVASMRWIWVVDCGRSEIALQHAKATAMDGHVVLDRWTTNPVFAECGDDVISGAILDKVCGVE